MDINEHLKEREISHPIKKFTEELREVFDEERTHPLLTKQTAEIGLLLLDQHRELRNTDHHWALITPATASGERYDRLKSLLPEDGFQSAALKDLLVYFFGSEKAEFAARAWDKTRFEMYQTGYTRRSFRAPANRDLYFVNQLNFLINALPQVFSWSYSATGNNRRFYDLSVAEQIRYSHFFPQSLLFRLWSAALDAGDAAVFRQMEDIIFNRDEIGKPTREIIKALLGSEKREAWELVGKLLLAAQRQEGLRQTILEALDETSAGGLKYIIELLISHKLARFSSVVRAVDVWAGFGWESEREKTVNGFLEKAREYLEEPQKIPDAVKSASNMDVYMALWAQGVVDVEKCAPYLNELYATGNAEKRALALKFAIETKHASLAMPLFGAALDDADLMVLAWALQGISYLMFEKPAEYRENPEFPELFEKLHKIVERGDASKEKSFEGRIFQWTRIVFNRDDALSIMIDLIGDNPRRLALVLGYFEQMSVSLRTKLTQHILSDFAAYDWDRKKKPAPTGFQRDFALRLLSDRGEFMVRTAFRALHETIFTDAEIEQLETLLKRKGADFRGKIIGLLLNQPDEKLAPAAARLLTGGDVEQRLAGLDILLQTKKANRLAAETGTLVEAFRSRKSISPKEEILLAQLSGTKENTTDYSAANGYALFDPKNAFSPTHTPRIDPENIFEKRLERYEFGFSAPLDEVKKALVRLGELYLANKDFEYDCEDWSGARQTVLLGNVFRSRRYNHKFASGREQFESYPLWEVWEKWFAESGLDAGDLTVIGLSIQPRAKISLPYIDELLPAEFNKHTYHGNPLINIIEALRLVVPFAEKQEFLLGGTARLFASLDEKVLQGKPREDRYYSYSSGDGWQSDQRYHVFYNALDAFALDDKFVGELWNLAHWRQFSGRTENIPHSLPSLVIFCRAFERGIIGEDELLRGLLTPENFRALSAKNIREQDFDYFARFPFLKYLFEKAREHVLDIELRRGDSATSVTRLAANLQAIYGARRFTEILSGLGKTPLNKGYHYYYGSDEINKQRSLSRLLKICFPLESDAPEEFEALVRQAKIGETKLIEAAVYAPQWQKFVSRFLNWKGLDSAIWWMHAHTKISGYREQTAEAESEIARYSAVDLQDFKDGAVDREWFLAAHREIGKVRWEIVYEAAKYISEGNGHRRARLYADVIAGKTKMREIVDRVKKKRDQDYLRVYGLAPLSRANPEKDVLSRYETLQKFKKESRQFGAQKQTSENLAVRIALENLARNAGFADPVRLTWAMETRQVQRILSSETEVKASDTSVKLVIDAEGKAELVTVKGDKTLKSIPPKLKKDKAILELQEHRKTLREQFARARAGLEEAMIRGDEFTLAELDTLFAHPVISKHLENLVFVAGKNLGFYRAGKLVAPDGSEISLAGNVRLAHCVDLHDSGAWSDYQRFCFDRALKQPFKQIFREFYSPTDDERREKSVSRRYAGHQIQPKQTVALLKTRGWKVDYEEGLQKVFHKQGFTAKMYALADWFSPAEVESPTLETVEFHSLKDYRRVAFETIDARIFSEVMRDIDLVVSVAHAGGVDPEASLSTIELRTVLLRETLRLFKLDNVELGGNHARIKGKLGEYSIHLGSAVVHQMPGKYLSVLPVQAQHRGRLFLPFADDDPKSAEVMSKVLMFARDHEIQDPTILRQLN